MNQRVEAFDVEVAGGGSARAVRVRTATELDRAIAVLGIPRGPVVLLVGGAAGLASRGRERIERFVAESFIPAVTEIGAIVVDGGTDAGIMRMVGAEHERVGGILRIVGVAPFARVRVPGSTGSTALARGHSDFVLVPGADWGAEATWFHLIADRLDSGPAATILVNGGPIALDEIEQSIDRGRTVIVVDGTSRAADDIAAAVRRRDAGTSQLAIVAASPMIVIVDVTISAAELARKLSGNHTGGRGR